jgi:hypothetical protein
VCHTVSVDLIFLKTLLLSLNSSPSSVHFLVGIDGCSRVARTLTRRTRASNAAGRPSTTLPCPPARGHNPGTLSRAERLDKLAHDGQAKRSKSRHFCQRETGKTCRAKERPSAFAFTLLQPRKGEVT